ncbi:hypothetical protein Glove_219g84 [Diversispora epigaea]|uniref:Uncharacterized protein n=1 Tax=Diversispora epigaea TaxID=1348612 RepID=A0A397IG53_9GLOM|nr:hypothetical protein Glove_219g84 [Diversispora epigaea]
MCRLHFYIKGTSANKNAVFLQTKQTNEIKIILHGGFYEEEMEKWWKNKTADDEFFKYHTPRKMEMAILDDDFDPRFFYIENEICYYVCDFQEQFNSNGIYCGKGMHCQNLDLQQMVSILNQTKWNIFIKEQKFLQVKERAHFMYQAFVPKGDRWIPDLLFTIRGRIKFDANEEMSSNSRFLQSENEEINSKYTRVVTGFLNVSQNIHNYLS